jgi:hypothetical protein
MTEGYQYDTIEAYRFTKGIIDGYLQELFGNYEYFTEVRHLSCTCLIRAQMLTMSYTAMLR